MGLTRVNVGFDMVYSLGLRHTLDLELMNTRDTKRSHSNHYSSGHVVN